MAFPQRSGALKLSNIPAEVEKSPDLPAANKATEDIVLLEI
jgi:hypothetical protein